MILLQNTINTIMNICHFCQQISVNRGVIYRHSFQHLNRRSSKKIESGGEFWFNVT